MVQEQVVIPARSQMDVPDENSLQQVEGVVRYRRSNLDD